MEEQTAPKLAFLGPPGSYSHQCAVEKFEDYVQYAEQSTITGVFRAVSEDIPFAVIPQENSTYGAVVDTYDALRNPEAGQSVFVRGELTLAVKHCLVVRSGVKLEDIQRVMSHEQALGQCTRFLSERLPGVTRTKVPSTSTAARAVLCCGEGTDEPESAAICSAHCASLFDGLEILYHDIQNEASNTTRFFILAHSLDVPLPGNNTKEPRRQRALIRVGNQVQHQREDEPPSASRSTRIVTSTLLTTFGCPSLRIDRRPSLNSIPFDDVYFLEVGDLTLPVTSSTIKNGEEEWLQRLQHGVEGVNAAGGEANILGLW